MNAGRLSLLGAFAGGCLSAAVVFGFWRTDPGATHQVPAPHSAPVAASLVDPSTLSAAPQRDTVDEAERAPEVVAQAEPAPAEPTAHAAEEVASASAAPGGSAVSDVLTDLEAAYRQRLIAAARAEAEAAPAPVAANTTPSEVKPAPEVATRTVAPVVPVNAVSNPSLPVSVAAPPPEPPAQAAPPAQVVVAQNDARPPDVHIGDVNQNTYNITNVRQGDVYVTQQLAMLQYMQLLGAASNLGQAQPTHVGRVAGQRSTPQFKQFPSTLTNLDNPWGFNFSPPNLVH